VAAGSAAEENNNVIVGKRLKSPDMKRIQIILLVSMIPLMMSGQTAQDALRYSRIYFNGTARFNGLAGAFGAVGADPSVMATNPAGLGLYNSFEFSISPSVLINKATTDYNGFGTSDLRTVFVLDNLAFVYPILNNGKKNGKGLKSFVLGFGMNRQNNFNSNISIYGPSSGNSLLTYYSDQLNQYNTPQNMVRVNFPYDIGLAWDAGLIYYDSLTGRYTNDAYSDTVWQEKNIQTIGSINEFDFSGAGNINDKLYFGFTFGVPTIRYYENDWYYEYDYKDDVPYFRDMAYNYYYETHGTGMNFKAGIIYRPANWVRIGAAIHTPTWYPSMHDSYYASMAANYDSVLVAPVQTSPVGYYDYSLVTPFRAIGSLAFFVGQHGFISAEYEYANYKQARFNSSDNSFSDVNTSISNNYKAPVNVRVGGEARFDFLRLRAGFGYYGAPVNSGTAGERYVASGGIGFFFRHFFADLTYQWSRTNTNYYLYDPSYVNPASLVYRSSYIISTCGFRF
jgi:hypothetical protein